MVLMGIDTGGTFTDFIYRCDGDWQVLKKLSTPENPARAVLDGVAEIRCRDELAIVHGTTVATNTLLERSGAKTALVTNRGFEDIIEIGRQNREQLYSLEWQATPALVPSTRRYGVDARIDCSGNVVEDLDERQVRIIMEQLRDEAVESVVVAMLFAFANPIHENRVRSILSALNIPISVSHEILAEFREYERISTTAVNAYVSPKLSRYLDNLSRSLGNERLRVMQSNGGLISAATAGREAVRTILSGPAGGVVGSWEMGKAAGFSRLITFDMGGTSTDVALVDDAIPFATHANIGGYSLKVPLIDIHTVGAGGGSVARIDTGGALTVGPQSAGADPGPVCFGKGERLTVTDANLYLGRLHPERFLGGTMPLDVERMKRLLERMAKTAGLVPTDLAEGILAVANTKMMGAIRAISVQRGIDPAGFTLFSYGGAGGMHAAFLAKMLNMPRVCIPRNPGLLSAVGMLLADVVKDFSKTVMMAGNNDSISCIDTHFQALAEKARREMAAEEVLPDTVRLVKSLDMRYLGQSFEIGVPYSDSWAADFHDHHQQIYGYCNRQRASEIVTIRLRAQGAREQPQLIKKNVPLQKRDMTAVPETWQKVVIEAKEYRAPVYQRETLACGDEFNGPAIIVEYSSTIVVPPWACAWVDAYENVILTII